MPPIPMAKEISCRNFKGLIAYVRKYYGSDGVHKLIAGLVDGDYYIQDKYDPTRIIPIQEEHLTDQAYWVSNEFSLILLSNVRKVVSGPNPLFTAGTGMVQESLSKTTFFVAKNLSTEILAKRASKLNTKFNRTKDVHLAEYTGTSAVFRIDYRPGFRVTKDVCNWNLGIYTGIAELSGATIVGVKETECVLEGAPCCRFSIQWKKKRFLFHLLGDLLDRMIGWRMKELIADYENTIEERDRLIESLVRSEGKYRALFEDSFEAMYLADKGTFLDVNSPWLKLYGVSKKEDVIGKNILDFVHPHDRNIMFLHQHEWPRKKKQIIRVRNITEDGRTMDVEIYYSWIEYEGRDVILATVKKIPG